MDGPLVALVNGGNRGIGLEVCRQLAGRGYTVVLGSRDAEKCRRAHPRVVNVSSESGSLASMANETPAYNRSTVALNAVTPSSSGDMGSW